MGGSTFAQRLQEKLSVRLRSAPGLSFEKSVTRICPRTTDRPFEGYRATFGTLQRNRTTILYAKKIGLKLSDDEVYYTTCSLLVILTNLGSNLHCQKGLNLILFFHIRSGQTLPIPFWHFRRVQWIQLQSLWRDSGFLEFCFLTKMLAGLEARTDDFMSVCGRQL